MSFTLALPANLQEILAGIPKVTPLPASVTPKVAATSGGQVTPKPSSSGSALSKVAAAPSSKAGPDTQGRWYWEQGHDVWLEWASSRVEPGMTLDQMRKAVGSSAKGIEKLKPEVQKAILADPVTYLEGLAGLAEGDVGEGRVLYRGQSRYEGVPELSWGSDTINPAMGMSGGPELLEWTPGVGLSRPASANASIKKKDNGIGTLGLAVGIGLTFMGVPAALATSLGGGTMGAIASGAIVGAGTSAIAGGDPLKGAIAGGIAGGLGASDTFQSATNSAATSIESATGGLITKNVAGGIVSGATKAGTSALATGQDVEKAILAGGATGGIMATDTVRDFANDIGTAVGANTKIDEINGRNIVLVDTPSQINMQNAIDSGIGGAIYGGVNTYLNGGGLADVLKGAGVGGVTAATNTFIKGSVSDAVVGTPFEPAQNTIASGAAGATSGAVHAALTGGNVGNSALIGGVSGAAGGLAKDFGAPQGIINAATQVGGELTADYLAPTPQAPATPATPKPPTANSAVGLIWQAGGTVPQYQNITRKDMNWGQRKA